MELPEIWTIHPTYNHLGPVPLKIDQNGLQKNHSSSVESELVNTIPKQWRPFMDQLVNMLFMYYVSSSMNSCLDVIFPTVYMRQCQAGFSSDYL